MASIFTSIIAGDIPGRFVWRDDRAVVFFTIAPLAPGHVMVVPIEEIDHWLDLEPTLAAHLFEVARVIGLAQMEAFSPTRVGLIVAGLEVPHAHLHVVPIESEADLDFANADGSPDASVQDAEAEALRAALRAAGRSEVVDG